MSVVVDVHTHFLPAEVVHAASLDTPDIEYRVHMSDAEGALYDGKGRAAGFVVRQLVDPLRRLEDMDRMGVDVQVLSVPPPFGFFHTQDLDLSVRTGRVLNEGIAAAVASAPDRFLGLATVPIHHPEAAVSVLEDAMTSLRLRGAEIATRVGEANLDDPALEPFFAAAEKLRAVIFVHSTRGLGAERLADYHFGNLIGNPTEDAIATASLIFGGVIERHPQLRVYIAHGGGSCPALAGRWDRGWMVRSEGRRHITDAPSSYLRRMHFDSLTHGVAQLESLVRSTGARQVMLGTDYPYDMAEPDPVGRVEEAGNLSADDRRRILADNAAELFSL